MSHRITLISLIIIIFVASILIIPSLAEVENPQGWAIRNGTVSYGSYNATATEKYQVWVWQKGVFSNATDNTTAVSMELTIPTGEIYSKGSLQNYVGALTKTGDFIQVGIYYKNPIIVSDMHLIVPSIFCSDGKSVFYFDEPYVEGHHYRFVIFYNNGWWIYVKDNDTGKASEIQAYWAHGNEMKWSDVTLESTARNQEDLVTTISQIGSLSNVENETFNIYANGIWTSPSNVTDGSSYEINTIAGETMAHSIPPPFISFFNNYGVNQYEVGFTQHEFHPSSVTISTPTTLPLIPIPTPTTTQTITPIPTPVNSTSIPWIPTKTPNWVKNIYNFYAQGDISNDELNKALQFLIKQGIIKLF